MRLGIYGGTFDPVHYGHLLLAEQCREQCALDEVWFVPAAHPPHKPDWRITAARARAEMLELAVAGHASFRVDRRELQREGPSYTVQTLREIASERPDDQLHFLMGSDSLAELSTWREPGEIARLSQLVVANRAGTATPAATDLRAALGPEIAAAIRFVTMPGVDFAARDLRQRIADGRSIRYCVPPAVVCYIQEHRLYDGGRAADSPPAV